MDIAKSWALDELKVLENHPNSLAFSVYMKNKMYRWDIVPTSAALSSLTTSLVGVSDSVLMLGQVQKAKFLVSLVQALQQQQTLQPSKKTQPVKFVNCSVEQLLKEMDGRFDHNTTVGDDVQDGAGGKQRRGQLAQSMLVNKRATALFQHQSTAQSVHKQLEEQYEQIEQLLLQEDATLDAARLCARLNNELMALDAANVHAIIQTDEQSATLLKLINSTIAELDSLDAWLGQFHQQLLRTGGDIRHIETQNKGLQVQTLNQNQLVKELSRLIQAMSLSDDTRKVLEYESFDSFDGGERVRLALNELSSVLFAGTTASPSGTADVLSSPTSPVSSATVGHLDESYMAMSAVQERRSELQSICERFTFRFLMFIQGLVETDVEHILHEPALSPNTTHLSGFRFNLSAHEEMEYQLFQHFPILMWVKRVDPDRVDDAARQYAMTIAKAYKKEFKDYTDLIRMFYMRRGADHMVTSSSSSALTTPDEYLFLPNQSKYVHVLSGLTGSVTTTLPRQPSSMAPSTAPMDASSTPGSSGVTGAGIQSTQPPKQGVASKMANLIKHRKSPSKSTGADRDSDSQSVYSIAASISESDRSASPERKRLGLGIKSRINESLASLGVVDKQSLAGAGGAGGDRESVYQLKMQEERLGIREEDKRGPSECFYRVVAVLKPLVQRECSLLTALFDLDDKRSGSGGSDVAGGTGPETLMIPPRRHETDEQFSRQVLDELAQGDWLAGRDPEVYKRVESLICAVFEGVHADLMLFTESLGRMDMSLLISILVSIELVRRQCTLITTSSTNNHSEEEKATIILPFLDTMLQLAYDKVQVVWWKFIQEQVRAIDETKLTAKQRTGAPFFIKVFPSFVRRMESLYKIPVLCYQSEQRAAASLSNVVVDLGTRSVLDKAYDKLLKCMFDTLDSLAKEIEQHMITEQKEAADDKETLNLHILNIVNMHYLHTELQGLEVLSLVQHVDYAKTTFDLELKTYIYMVVRKPLGKLLEFFEGIEELMKTKSAEEVSYHLGYNKQALKKVVTQYPVKEIRKSIEALYKRVEKHFGAIPDATSLASPISPSTSSNPAMITTTTGTKKNHVATGKLLQIVWSRVKVEFVQMMKRFESLMEQCFRESEIKLLFTEDDLSLAFDDISRAYGF